MKKFLLLALCTASLAACESTKRTSFEQESDFWERSDSVSSLYLRGPKAQHQLHKDIAACVAEVKELSRLGTIRDANPPANIEMNVNLAEKWQSPGRDGPLHKEYRDFHDFDSCMAYKGWKRVSYVKPEQIDQAKQNYRTTILGETIGLTDDEVKPAYTPNRAKKSSGSYND